MSISASNQFYVYIYLDPRKSGKYKYGEFEFDYEPFLIGKGGYEKRRYEHLFKSQLKKCGNKLKVNKILKIRKITGNDPIIIKYKENMLEKESHNLETLMIKTIGRIDLKTGPLVNMTDGGEGESGRTISLEQREKISKALTGKYVGQKNPNYGNKWSDEQRQKEILRNLGKHLSEETKEKISKGNKGKKLNFTKEWKENMSKSAMKYVYIFISPNNEIYIVDRFLVQFCKKHRLSKGNVTDNNYYDKNGNRILSYSHSKGPRKLGTIGWTISRKPKENK